MLWSSLKDITCLFLAYGENNNNVTFYCRAIVFFVLLLCMCCAFILMIIGKFMQMERKRKTLENIESKSGVEKKINGKKPLNCVLFFAVILILWCHLGAFYFDIINMWYVQMSFSIWCICMWYKTHLHTLHILYITTWIKTYCIGI